MLHFTLQSNIIIIFYHGYNIHCLLFILGDVKEERAILGKPVGKHLYFAGEHTNPDQPSTVHGAYISGISAAKKIIEDWP